MEKSCGVTISELKDFRPCYCSRFGERVWKCMEEVDQSKLCQISMDRPSVNWKFFNSVTKKREEDELPALINIGSCGLHVIHGAFKTGVEATNWNIKNFAWCILHFAWFSSETRRLWKCYRLLKISFELLCYKVAIFFYYLNDLL